MNNDEQNTQSTSLELEPASFEFELADGEDVSEIAFEEGQLNDINYGF